MSDSTETWHDVGSVTDCPIGKGIETVVLDRIIAVFHTDNGWYAISGTCPHHGGPLGKGSLQGCVVTCPWHGWQFDVSDGTYQHSSQLKHPTHEIRIVNERIEVRLRNG